MKQSQSSLKRMKKNYHSEIKGRMSWTNSPCSLPYPQTFAIMTAEKRFRYGSIYQKNDIDDQRAEKKIDPTSLLRQFRREINDATPSKNKNFQIKKNLENHIKREKKIQESKKGPNNPSVYQIPQKTALQFDRFGNRSYLIGQYDVKSIQDKILKNKSGFSYSRRLDLSRPLNFVPGPGTYIEQNKQQHKAEPKKKTFNLIFTHKKCRTNFSRQYQSQKDNQPLKHLENLVSNVLREPSICNDIVMMNKTGQNPMKNMQLNKKSSIIKLNFNKQNRPSFNQSKTAFQRTSIKREEITISDRV